MHDGLAALDRIPGLRSRVTGADVCAVTLILAAKPRRSGGGEDCAGQEERKIGVVSERVRAGFGYS
jgi:hypothetical protein